MVHNKPKKSCSGPCCRVGILFSFIIPPANEVAGVYSDPYVRPFVRPSVPPNL